MFLKYLLNIYIKCKYLSFWSSRLIIKRFIHLEVKNPNITPMLLQGRKSIPARFNRRRRDWKKALVLHTRAISVSFFFWGEKDFARWGNETTVSRARALTKSLRTWGTWNPLVWVCLDALAANLASSFALSSIPLSSHPPSQSTSLVRQDVTSIGIARTERQKRWALWELDLKALHFGEMPWNQNIYHPRARQIVCVSNFHTNCFNCRPSGKINRDLVNITAMGIFLSSRIALALGHQNFSHWSYYDRERYQCFSVKTFSYALRLDFLPITNIFLQIFYFYTKPYTCSYILDNTEK